uniref:Uncharacterized protein n=1 Tax=Arundo donax TaxID=35708 RepID=A0A0A9BK67_ARUDO
MIAPTVVMMMPSCLQQASLLSRLGPLQGWQRGR